MSGKGAKPPADQVIARLAAAQRGVVCRQQLELGVVDHDIGHRFGDARPVGRLQDKRRIDGERARDEFLRLCDRFGIRRPEVQPWIGPDRPDFLWPDFGLVVETDSWRWHGGRTRWEADQRNALRLQQRA